MNENQCILFEIVLKSVPMGRININPAVVQVMTWRRIGDKPMIILFTDAYIYIYMRNPASMIKSGFRTRYNALFIPSVWKHAYLQIYLTLRVLEIQNSKSF